MPLFLLFLLLATSAAAQTPLFTPEAEATAYVGGQWWDGQRFTPRDTTWATRGVFVDARPETVTRTVRLGAAYVVPPFGDAHLHAFSDPQSLASQDRRLVARGVFYALNPNVPLSERDRVRGAETTVDVAYANGGITAPGAHPVPIYESRALGLTISDMWGPRAAEIRASRLAEGDAYHLALTPEDLDGLWPRVLAGRPDAIKIYLLHSEEWADGTPDRPRGLSPAVAAEVVRRAHAAGLPVVAHVETAADARTALAAGVDVLAHAPGYGVNAEDPAAAEGGAYVMSDALLADLADAGLAVTPTLARGPASVQFIPEPYRPDSAAVAVVRRYHRDLYRRLADAGVPISIGADAGNLWAWDEAAYAVEGGGLTTAEALQAWAVTTPQVIYPGRALGRLGAGYEASLLALACDPLADWSCTGQITHREKQGVRVGVDPEDMAEVAAAWERLDVSRFTAAPEAADGPLLRGLKALTDADLAAAEAALDEALATAPDSLRPFVRARLAEVAEERFDFATAVTLRSQDDPEAVRSVQAGFGRFPAPRLRMDGPEAVVPFDGLTVPVAVNGEPVRAVVDTGAPGTGVPRALVERLGLRVDTTARGVSRVPSMGLEFDVYAVLLDSVTVGGATLYNVPATVGWRDDEATPEDEGERIFLGANVLRHLADGLRYDYADSTFAILGDLPEADARPTFLIDGGSAPVVPVTVDETPANAIVDTGNQVSVYLARGAFDLSETPVAETRSGDGWSVDLYDLPFTIPGHPDGTHIAYEGTFVFSADDPITVILGRPVWAGGALTLDFVNRRVRFDAR